MTQQLRVGDERVFIGAAGDLRIECVVNSIMRDSWDSRIKAVEIDCENGVSMWVHPDTLF